MRSCSRCFIKHAGRLGIGHPRTRRMSLRVRLLTSDCRWSRKYSTPMSSTRCFTRVRSVLFSRVAIPWLGVQSLATMTISRLGARFAKTLRGELPRRSKFRLEPARAWAGCSLSGMHSPYGEGGDATGASRPTGSRQGVHDEGRARRASLPALQPPNAIVHSTLDAPQSRAHRRAPPQHRRQPLPTHHVDHPQGSVGGAGGRPVPGAVRLAGSAPA